MFLKDSIGPVLEEIWQLAMTLASLKHIAGVLSQEMDAGQTLEDKEEENIRTTDSQDPFQVIRKDIKDENSPEPIAEIKSEDFTECVEYLQVGPEISEVHDEIMHISSITHQLPAGGVEYELSEVSASMVSHMIRYNDENNDIEMAVSLSMLAHTYPNIQSTNDTGKKETEKNIQDYTESVTIIAHQVPSFMTVEESSDFPVSMVCHQDVHPQYETVNDMVRSFLSHEQEDHRKDPNKVCKELKIEKESEESQTTTTTIDENLKLYQEEDVCQSTEPLSNPCAKNSVNDYTNENNEVFQDLVSIKSPEPANIDIAQENIEIQASMTSHQHTVQEKKVSSVSHRQLEHQTNTEDNSDEVKMYFISSFVSHINPAVEIPDFLTDLSPSLASHSVQHAYNDENLVLPIFTALSQEYLNTYAISNKVEDDIDYMLSRISDPFEEETIYSILSHQIRGPESSEEEYIFLTSLAAHHIVPDQDCFAGSEQNISIQAHDNIDYSKVNKKVTFIEEEEKCENVSNIAANEHYLSSMVAHENLENIEHYSHKNSSTPLHVFEEYDYHQKERGAISRVAHQIICCSNEDLYSYGHNELKDKERIPLTFEHQTMLIVDESRKMNDIPPVMDSPIANQGQLNPGFFKNEVHPISFEDISYREAQDTDKIGNTLLLTLDNEEFKDTETLTMENIMDSPQTMPDQIILTPPYPSFVGHQLPMQEMPNQFEEFIVSSTSFQSNFELENENILPSMVCSFQNSTQYEKENANVGCEIFGDYEVSSSLSVTHETSSNSHDQSEYHTSSMLQGQENELASNMEMKERTEPLSSKNTKSLSCSYTSRESEKSMDQENEITEKYNEKLERVKELQKLVETEIEEFDNKRCKRNFRIIENDLETTETHIVSNVKNVVFESHIVFHQHDNEFNNGEHKLLENNKTHSNESINSIVETDSQSSGVESIESVVCVSSRSLNDIDEVNEDVQEEILEYKAIHETCPESVLEASCILDDNSPMIVQTHITSIEDIDKENNRCTEIGFDHNQEGQENNENQSLYYIKPQDEHKSLEDIKSRLRKVPRKASNVEIKIREKELLESFFQEGLKNSEKRKETQKMTNEKEKVSKQSFTLATLNEKVRKQTYKIRFKVNLSKDSSKSSVLHYLLGCFGGEKLLGQQK